MQTGVRSCVPHQRLLDALEVMGEEEMDWVGVVETLAGAEWLGWITSFDAAVFLGSFDRRPSEVMCRELIAQPPVVLAAEGDLGEGYDLIRRACRQRLPVLERGRLAGILRLP